MKNWVIHFFLCFIFTAALPAQTDTLRVVSEANQFHIYSIPDGAKVFINDTLAGVTPLTILGLPKQEKRLRLVMDGYKDWVTSFASYNVFEHDIVAVMDDKFGLLSIFSDPLNAEVFVNDTLVGKTPIQSLKLKIGRYNVSIRKKGFETWDAVVPVARIAAVYSPKLVSCFSYVSFNKSLNPSGILIDGKRITSDSLQFRSISSGMHEVEYAVKSSGRTISEKIDFKPDNIYSLSLGSHSLYPFFLSALIPGAGQIKNGSYLKGIAILAGAITSGIFTYSAVSNYSTKLEDAKNAQNMYLHSGNENQAMYYRQLVLTSRSDADKALKYKRIAIGALLGVYIYNLVDALLFEPGDFLKIGTTKIKTQADLGMLYSEPYYRIGLNFQIK